MCRRVADCDPHRARVRCGLPQDGGPGIGDVEICQARQPGITLEDRLFEDQVGQGAVAAGHHILKYLAAEHTPGLLRHRLHHCVGLVGAAPGKPLLGLASGGGPGLYILRAGLGGKDESLTRNRHAVSSAAHQDQADPARLGGERSKPFNETGSPSWPAVGRPRRLQQCAGAVGGEQPHAVVVVFDLQRTVTQPEPLHPTGKPGTGYKGGPGGRWRATARRDPARCNTVWHRRIPCFP